jgi:hypothetical protein
MVKAQPLTLTLAREKMPFEIAPPLSLPDEDFDGTGSQRGVGERHEVEEIAG